MQLLTLSTRVTLKQFEGKGFKVLILCFEVNRPVPELPDSSFINASSIICLFKFDYLTYACQCQIVLRF